MKTTSNPNLLELTNTCDAHLKRIFTHYCHDVPSLDLKMAMEHALMNGGKRLRPLLVYATGAIFDAPLEHLDIPASAIEIMHTYSLIHDDLPCMDDADIRRGKPACHKLYGDGMAVLAGDALQTLAMQIVASHPSSLPAHKRLQMLSVLTHAAGPYGMAAGQALDITVMNESISADLLEDIYRLKTGCLISACIELGRLSSHDEDDTNHRALTRFGELIGLAFQIQDDIIDMESPVIVTGKPQGIDAKNNKTTYPKLHGVNAAKDKVQNLYQAALEEINYLGHRAQLLRQLIGQMLDRNK